MDVRESYAEAARSFAALIDHVPRDAYDRPGLGDWDLRSLVGHTSRALVTVHSYLDRPAGEPRVVSAADYFAQGVGGSTDAAAVLERGRAAGAALGDDPASYVRTLVAGVLAKVAPFDLGYALETVAGPMRLCDYLPTRTFELVVHGLDIARATGLATTYSEGLLADATCLAGEVAARRGHGVDVLLALTGRADLPSGFSVV